MFIKHLNTNIYIIIITILTRIPLTDNTDDMDLRFDNKVALVTGGGKGEIKCSWRCFHLKNSPQNYDIQLPRRYFCCGSICFMFLSRMFLLFEPYVSFHSFS